MDGSASKLSWRVVFDKNWFPQTGDRREILQPLEKYVANSDAAAHNTQSARRNNLLGQAMPNQQIPQFEWYSSCW